MNIGIPACGVVSATIKAPTVIPGVVASSENVGDRVFGELPLQAKRSSQNPCLGWHGFGFVFEATRNGRLHVASDSGWRDLSQPSVLLDGLDWRKVAPRAVDRPLRAG
jgi:hypothetical protein